MSKKSFNLNDVLADASSSMEDLFGGASIENPKSVPNEVKNGSEDIPIGKLTAHKNHTFLVKDDEDMEKLVTSIKENGIIVPLIVRAADNGNYEIISGHRRKHAAEKVGLKEVPCIVIDADDDTADILMVDSNLQREKILPSEKAFSYKVKLEAMKRQGKRTDLDNGESGGRSIDVLASQENVTDSSTQISRYIRLTHLDRDLLNMVDNDLIGLVAGVNLSFLNDEDQLAVVDAVLDDQIPISTKQAKDIRKAAKNGLNRDKVLAILKGEFKAKTAKKDKPKFNEKTFKPYMPENVVKMPLQKRIKFCEDALKFYSEYIEKHPDEFTL